MTPRFLLRILILGAVAGPGCGAPEDDRAVSWPYIASAILAPNCATSSCHNTAVAVSGLDLSTPERAYDSLIYLELPKREGMEDQLRHRPLVTPFNPAESRVVHMLRANATRRMPPDRPLAEGDIQLIERWILEGAKEE